MDTQVVLVSLASTVSIEAESPAAAAALVESNLANVSAEQNGIQVHIGLETKRKTKAFNEGTDPPGGEDDWDQE